MDPNPTEPSYSEFLSEIHTIVTQYLIPTVLAIFAAVYQIISTFRTKLGNNAKKAEVANVQDETSNPSNELLNELKIQYTRQRQSQKFMLVLIVVVVLGFAYVFLDSNKKLLMKTEDNLITKTMNDIDGEVSTLKDSLKIAQKTSNITGIVSMESLFEDKDQKAFSVVFEKRCDNICCSDEYTCFANEQQSFHEIKRYIDKTMQEDRNVDPILFLTGFATQDADFNYNSEVSMKRAIKVYERLSKEKYIVGGINIAELSDTPNERGNTTSVRVSIAWHPKSPAQLAKESKSQSESSGEVTSPTITPSEEDPIPQSSVIIEDLYTTDAITFDGSRTDQKISSFKNGDRVYARFKVRSSGYQHVWLVWKNSDGQPLRAPKQMDLTPASNRIHDYKSAFPKRGSYTVEIIDSNNKVLESTTFSIN